MVTFVKGRGFPKDLLSKRAPKKVAQSPVADTLGPRRPKHDFSGATAQTIGVRAGWKCSNPRCRKGTAAPGDDPNDAVRIGEAAHIAAASVGGKRHDPSMTKEQRESPRNGIWLCPTDHRQIDRDAVRFTTAKLLRWKAVREAEARREVEESAMATLRFVSIQIVDGLCAWRSAWRWRNSAASVGFHEVKRKDWAAFKIRKSAQFSDPVFDIAIKNTSATTVVLSAVGIEPLRLWSDLKGMPEAIPLNRATPYHHRVRPLVEDELQMTPVADPIEIPRGKTYRFRLQLSGFKKAMSGNESDISFVVQHQDQLTCSWRVYLGSYG